MGVENFRKGVGSQRSLKRSRVLLTARLAEAAGERLVLPVQANEVFIRVTAEEAAALRAKGFDFYDWGPGEARLVTSWDSDPEGVATLAAAIAQL